MRADVRGGLRRRDSERREPVPEACTRATVVSLDRLTVDVGVRSASSRLAAERATHPLGRGPALALTCPALPNAARSTLCRRASASATRSGSSRFTASLNTSRRLNVALGRSCWAEPSRGLPSTTRRPAAARVPCSRSLAATSRSAPRRDAPAAGGSTSSPSASRGWRRPRPAVRRVYRTPPAALVRPIHLEAVGAALRRRVLRRARRLGGLLLAHRRLGAHRVRRVDQLPRPVEFRTAFT